MKQIFTHNALRAVKEGKLGRRCLVKAVALWDTPDFCTEAGKQLQIVMAAVGFRVNIFALNRADGSPSMAVRCPPPRCPQPACAWRHPFQQSPYRLTFQAEMQGLDATADSVAWKSAGTALLAF